MKNISLWMIYASLLFSISLNAADLRISVEIPKAAYVQWTDEPGPLTNPNGDLDTETASYISPTSGGLISPGAQTSYFQIMCNSVFGYEVDFQSSGATDGSSASLTHTISSETLGISLNLAAYNTGSTLSPTINLSLNNSAPDIQSGPMLLGELPLIHTDPHVYAVTVNFPSFSSSEDDLLPHGSYEAVLTVNITLP